MDPVVHFEVPVDDVERAKKFYSEVFGWKMNQMGPEMGNYVVVQTGGTDEKGMPLKPGFINGGIVKRTGKVPQGDTFLCFVIATQNLEGTLGKIEKAGGKKGERNDIPSVGKYSNFKDSENNIVGLLEPIMPGNPQM